MKKINARIAALFIGGFSALVISSGFGAITFSLPYTFTAGTTAVAAEVNANFSALLSAIQSTSDRVAVLEASASPALPSFTTTPIDLNAGDTFSFGGENYTMKQYEVVDPASGTHYSILFPAQTSSNVFNVEYRLGDAFGTPVSTTTVTGFPVKIGHSLYVGFYPATDSVDAYQDSGIAGSVVFPSGVSFEIVISTMASASNTAVNTTDFRDSYVANLNQVKQLLRYMKVSAI